MFEIKTAVVGEAADGISAWNLYKKLQPEVIITDIRMPEVDGLHFIKKIKQLNENIISIIVSGYDDSDYLHEALKIGAFDYQLKPIDKDEFFCTLRRAKRYLDINTQKKEEYQRIKQELVKATHSISFQKKTPSIMDYYSGKNQLVIKAVAFVMNNYHKPINLESVSANLFVHPKYFSSLFKKEMNQGFTDFLTAYRINCSLELLKKSNLKVSEIASIVGYKDPGYFNKVFKSIQGIAPIEYKTDYDKLGADQ